MQPIKPEGPGPEAQFKAFLKQGRFMIQKSRSTGEHVFYPRVAAPGSGVTDLDWVDASGAGTIYSITVGRSKAGSQNIAIVELAEGPRLMTRIEGVETAPIGAKVKARIIDADGEPAIVFDLAEGAKA